jgi:putative transposase
MNLFYKRQGQMETRDCYFYTETICDFRQLLQNDELKMVVINSWKNLVDRGLAVIYGYIIMPNHIHLLWNMLQRNGKESVGSSFAKFTAHQFKKYLSANDLIELQNYESSKRDRQYQFWKRDPLAVPIDSEEIFLQKLEYIHNNPVQEKWGLSQNPEEYRWSSARFYADGVDEFGILTHFRE